MTSIEDVAPDIVFDNPMDMEFGPDGALYVLEYGTGYFAELPEAQLARIDWTRGNRTPVPVVTADVEAGLSPLTVQFSSAGTADADGDALRYAWDFDADGRVDSRAQNPSFTYTENGVYEATLNVTDSTGRRACGIGADRRRQHDSGGDAHRGARGRHVPVRRRWSPSR